MRRLSSSFLVPCWGFGSGTASDSWVWVLSLELQLPFAEWCLCHCCSSAALVCLCFDPFNAVSLMELVIFCYSCYQFSSRLFVAFIPFSFFLVKAISNWLFCHWCATYDDIDEPRNKRPKENICFREYILFRSIKTFQLFDCRLSSHPISI